MICILGPLQPVSHHHRPREPLRCVLDTLSSEPLGPPPRRIDVQPSQPAVTPYFFMLPRFTYKRLASSSRSPTSGQSRAGTACPSCTSTIGTSVSSGFLGLDPMVSPHISVLVAQLFHRCRCVLGPPCLSHKACFQQSFFMYPLRPHL